MGWVTRVTGVKINGHAASIIGDPKTKRQGEHQRRVTFSASGSFVGFAEGFVEKPEMYTE